MTNSGLSKEDRLCLQFWFRQAIVKIERQEVTARLLKMEEFEPVNHGHVSIQRRTIHGQRTLRSKALTQN